jgi:hypothetical protein
VELCQEAEARCATVSSQVKTYKPVRVSRAAYAGAAGYVFVVFSWIAVYEILFLYLQDYLTHYPLGPQLQQILPGILALCVSATYGVVGWSVTDSFYKSRKETVDHYSIKTQVLLFEDGKQAEGNMLLAEDSVIPYALYNKNLKVISRIGENPSFAAKQVLANADIRPIGTSADQQLVQQMPPTEIVPVASGQTQTIPPGTVPGNGEVVDQDNTPAFIGYMIVPNPEFELFDVLVVAIPVSFSRLLGAQLLKEFAYKGLLVFRPVAFLALVKIHRLYDKDNRSILVAEVGWSAYHAEMMAIHLKVSSISTLDTVKIRVPVADDKGVVAMHDLDVPAGAAIFSALDNWKTPKLQETIASKDSTIEALKGRTKSVKQQAGELSAEDDQLLRGATGGGESSLGGLTSAIKNHKKTSIGVVALVAATVILILLGAVKI